MANDTRASYARIGFAILAGTVATAVTLVYLGGLRGHRNEVFVETYYDREVSGLSVGSPVNFRGVKIGEVREIDFVGNKYATKGSDGLRIYILMALNPKKLGYFRGEGLEASEAVAYLVKSRGLRATVTASGITGLSRIECDLTPGTFPPAETFAWTPKHPFVPQKASLMDNFSDAATRVMNQINTMDLGAVWSNVNESVSSMSRTLQTVQTMMETCQGEVEKVAADVSDAASSLKDFAGELKANPALILRERRPQPLDETR